MRIGERFLSLALAAWLGCAAWGLGKAEYDMNRPQNLEASHLFAESALLVDQDTGEVLFSKDSRVRMYPASTTKIMTLLLGLESGIALEDQVTIPAEAGDVPEGSSVVPVMPGDVMSFGDLLYGFMLSSGNDGANAVAVLVDGSIDAFVDHMNQRAAKIGCEGTHYVNAHGYHDAGHYTTAQDLALISLEAMKNPDFCKIVAAPKWTMNIQRDGKTIQQEIVSRNTLLQSGEKYYYPDCTGIKTGHHNKAGWCFVGSAEREGMRVICVVLKCEQEMSKWYDAARLFEYGFTRYERVTAGALIDAAWRRRYTQIQVEDADPGDAQGGSLALNLTMGEGAGDAVTVPVIAGSEASLNAAVDRLVSVEWTRSFAAPVEADEVMGTLTCAVDGAILKGTLTAARAVAARPVPTPTNAPTLTEAAGESPVAAASEPPVRHKGSGPVIMVVLAALLSASAAAVVTALKRAGRRKRRRTARRGRAQARPQNRSRSQYRRGGGR